MRGREGGEKACGSGAGASCVQGRAQLWRLGGRRAVRRRWSEQRVQGDLQLEIGGKGTERTANM